MGDECPTAAQCTNLGVKLQKEGKPVDAVHAYARGCLFGSGQACFDLAHLMLAGEGVESDPGAAATVFSKGCSDLRHGPSCHALGALYRKGYGSPAPDAKEPSKEGVPKIGPRAAVAYAMGCEMGHSPSCTALGLMKVNADGIEQAGDEARDLFKRACDDGDATACTCLGVCHATGLGGEPDMKVATELFQQACDAGSAEACAFLEQAAEAAKEGKSHIAAKPLEDAE